MPCCRLWARLDPDRRPYGVAAAWWRLCKQSVRGGSLWSPQQSSSTTWALSATVAAHAPEERGRRLRRNGAHHHGERAGRTIARPPRLTNGPLIGRYRVENGHLPDRSALASISRADVAHFLLSDLETATRITSSGLPGKRYRERDRRSAQGRAYVQEAPAPARIAAISSRFGPYSPGA